MQTEIYPTSISGLFDLILVLLITYYAFSFFFRYLVPIMLKNFVQSQQQKYNAPDTQSRAQQKREGEVTIQYKEEQERKGKSGTDDEYVDYEEVKD